MRKISTLFKKDPNNLSKVLEEFDPENLWVFDEGVKATRKFDGTACAIIDGLLYKRYDVKKGKQAPNVLGWVSIPCQEPDKVTGHWPHWVYVNQNDSSNKWLIEALNKQEIRPDGTYELCGPKINGNKDKFESHTLVPHGKEIIHINYSTLTLGYMANCFNAHDKIEGIVFHHPDGRMCKIRRRDFGFKW